MGQDVNEWGDTDKDGGCRDETDEDEDSRDAGFHDEDILPKGCGKGFEVDSTSAAAEAQARKHDVGCPPRPRRQA